MRSTMFAIDVARAARPRRRRVDRRVHRLSAAARRAPRGGARRRSRPTARTAACRSAGDESRTLQRPPCHRRADRRRRWTSSSATCRSSRCGWSIPSLVALCQPGRPMVLLVKPQFEAGRAEVSKGKGVITDPDVRRPCPRRGRGGARRGGLRCRGMDRVADCVAPTATSSTSSTRSTPRGSGESSTDRRRRARSSPITSASRRAMLAEKAAAWCAAQRTSTCGCPPTTPRRSMRRASPSSARSPRPTSCSAWVATARCCAASGCSTARRCRCSASTSARSAT